MDLRSLPGYRNIEKKQLQQRQKTARMLNAQEKVQYPEALALKEQVIKACFDTWYSQHSK